MSFSINASIVIRKVLWFSNDGRNKPDKTPGTGFNEWGGGSWRKHGAPTLPDNGGSRMYEIIALLAFIGIWLLVQLVILPKMGISS